MKLGITAIAIAILACVNTSYGDIIGNTIADDGDGVVTCDTYGFQKVADYEFELSIDGLHNQWDSGHILGDIITDTELDPKLTLFHDIDNDTDRLWTGYHVKVAMSKSFTFDNVTVANDGWTSSVIAPTKVGNNWIGYVNYYAGDAVANGDTLSFGYRMTFIGAASFCEELTPIPEPATITLLVCGAAGIIARRRRAC